MGISLFTSDGLCPVPAGNADVSGTTGGAAGAFFFIAPTIPTSRRYTGSYDTVTTGARMQAQDIPWLRAGRSAGDQTR